MAKAKPVNDLKCDAPALAGASEVLRLRLDEIGEFQAAAMGADGVDGVHDMRVASRRFRSALRDFAPLLDKKAVKALKKNVKGVANALGNVRDQDVAIEALVTMREKAPNEKAAAEIDLLVQARRNLRSEAHTEFVKHISPDRLVAIRGDLEEAFAIKPPVATAVAFRSFAADAIDRTHKRFLERAESIYDPFNDNALHKLRLSAKRLRYALELFNECWDGELKPFAKYVSTIQSSLGEVHDSSEWITYLGQIRDNYDIDRQTVAWLMTQFVSLRTAEYIKALELWNEWLSSDLTGSLRAIISK